MKTLTMMMMKTLTMMTMKTLTIMTMIIKIKIMHVVFSKGYTGLTLSSPMAVVTTKQRKR